MFTPAPALIPGTTQSARQVGELSMVLVKTSHSMKQ